MPIEIPLSGIEAGIEAAFTANAGQIALAGGFLGILIGMTLARHGAGDNRDALLDILGLCVFVGSLFVFLWGIGDSGLVVIT